ncbi:MAG: YdcF family protein [Acetobacter sp.]
MFLIGKLFGLACRPSALLTICLIAGLCLHRKKAGRILMAVAGMGFFLCLLLPVGDWALRPLENRFQIPAKLPEHIDGIIVLGGGINDRISQDRQTPVLSPAGNRMTTGVILAHRYPGSRLIFSGGSGAVIQGQANESDWAHVLFRELEVPETQITLENRSRTTWENALFSKELVHPDPGSIWLLVTSADHMPRAVGMFRKAGWNVIPYPTGYQTLIHGNQWLFSLSGTLFKLDTAFHEWAGLFAARLRHETDSLFPKP